MLVKAQYYLAQKLAERNGRPPHRQRTCPSGSITAQRCRSAASTTHATAPNDGCDRGFETASGSGTGKRSRKCRPDHIACNCRRCTSGDRRTGRSTVRPARPSCRSRYGYEAVGALDVGRLLPAQNHGALGPNDGADVGTAHRGGVVTRDRMGLARRQQQAEQDRSSLEHVLRRHRPALPSSGNPVRSRPSRGSPSEYRSRPGAANSRPRWWFDQKSSGAPSVTSFMTKNVRVWRTPGSAISLSP